MNKSRITITLHPNSSYLELALNDRFFNKEQYSFSRKEEARGDEATLLKTLNEEIVGITKAETSKNLLKLEISRGMLLNEFIPAVVFAVKQFCGRGYEPEIYCDDQRYAINPEYDHSDEYGGRLLKAGVKVTPGGADIGVPYLAWKD